MMVGAHNTEHRTNPVPARGKNIIRTIFSGFLIIISSTLLYAAPGKPVRSRQPANATYPENATARFYVNAHSIDGGYLTYQWYRSQTFGAPQSDLGVIKNNAVTLSEGISATLTTKTPAVSGTQYCYYWVRITNYKDGESDFVESACALAKIVDRELPDHITNGDFSTVYALPGVDPMPWDNYGKSTKGWYTVVSQTRLPNWKTTDYYPEISPFITGHGDIRQAFQVFCLNLKPFGYKVGSEADMVADPQNPVSVNRTNPATATADSKNRQMVAYTGHGDRGGNTGNFGAIELANSSPSSVYQEISTVPGKIYEWSLEHIARFEQEDIMAVVIGAAINEQSELGADAALWNNDGVAELHYPYGASSGYKPAPTYFYKIVDALAKRIAGQDKIPADLSAYKGKSYTQEYNGHTYYVSIIASGKRWTKYSGIYTIPDGQGTTVFSFLGIFPTISAGNVLDNIVFASGSSLDPSPAITYVNDVSVSVSTKAGYVYGIAEVRGSSVSLVPDAAAYYDPDGSGASPETAISKTAGLGIDGWYSTYGTSNTPFTGNGVITFKNLKPGATYRTVGIPALAVNSELHTNESPEYVLDEGYYKDIQTAPACEGSNTVIWNIELDTYSDEMTERARISVINARTDVEYALLAGENSLCDMPATAGPAHIRTGWTAETAGRATFDSLKLNRCYFLVARPRGYDEVTYAGAAYGADGKTPKYIRIKTPGTVADLDEIDVSYECTYVTVRSATGYTYALANPETGVIVGSTQEGDGSTLFFRVTDATKKYRMVTKSGDVNWMRGVMIYPCPGRFSTDYFNELVRSDRTPDGSIPTDIEYYITCDSPDGTFSLSLAGSPAAWVAGTGAQPVNLAEKILAGNTVSILDTVTSLNIPAMAFFRLKWDAGYDGKRKHPDIVTVIPVRPPAPSAPVNYVFNYKDEKITAVSDSLYFARTGETQWTTVYKNGSWTFADAGWGEGMEERLFSVRIPANSSAFASAVRRDTVPARPAAPEVGLKSNDDISKAVIFNMIDGREYEYYTSLSPAGWISYTPNGTTESDSIDCMPGAACYVRFAATNTAPASVAAVLSSPIAIQPVHFTRYTYGDKPVAAPVVVSNSISSPIDVLDIALDGDSSQCYHFAGKPSDAAGKQVPANGTNTNWTVIPNDSLDAGTYNTLLKMTYTYRGKEYTAYADVFLTVEKAKWDMSAVKGVFDVSQTGAQKLVLNISGAPAGARLSYYYGLTPVAGAPESTVGDDGKAAYTFTGINGLQAGTTYTVSAVAREDVNHHASAIIPLANGYTAYATPVFDDIVSIDYINERLTLAAGHSSADYTLRCASCPSGTVIESPYPLYDILENTVNDSITFSIVHNAGVGSPYPASEAGYSDTVQGRSDAPANITVTIASDSASYDGRIDLAGHFEYRIHGTATWSSASGSVTGLGVGAYDVRRSATNASFASRIATLTVKATVSPLSGKYVACPGAAVTVGFQTAAGISCYWYGTQSGGTSLGSGNTRTVTKDASVRQTLWMEPQRNGVAYPRVRVEVELGDCGVVSPSGCAATGTVIYREDFGGNSPDDPTPKPSGIPQVTGYVYGVNLSDPSGGFHGNVYAIAKSSATFGHPNWNREIDDHTYPGNLTRGYLTGFDGSATAGQFYECQIDGLCSGLELYFSVWIANILKNTAGARDVPHQIFHLEDLTGNVLAQYHTFVPNNGDNTWKQYGFRFVIPDNVSSVKLKIINSSTGSAGNDFAFDDIEVRLCTPPASLTAAKQDTVLCTGNTFTFQGSYTDGGFFGNSLVYRWEHNSSGDINSPDAWKPVASSRGTSVTGTVNSVYTVDSVTAADAGYYRLALANDVHIDNYNCRAMSDIIHLQIMEGVVSGTVAADRTVCENTVPATLTATAATGGSATLTYQWQQSIDGGAVWTDVSGGTGGTTLNYTPPALRRTTMYRLQTAGGTNSCDTAYSNAVRVTVTPEPNYPDIRVSVCPDIGEVNLAKYIDTLDGIQNIQWSHRIAGIPVSSPDGTVSTEVLAAFRIHTLTYTVTSRCANGQERKVYLEILQDDFVRQPRDTVAVCYLTASALHINQLLGIEAGGTWSYPKEVAQYVAESASPVHDGAVVMNGKSVYEDASIPFISYRGTQAKTVRFTYATDSNSCLKGKTYPMVIVLTE
jgi:hypothetical protein